MRQQYYGDHTLAKKRNCCFKISYLNYVLKNYILQNSIPCESIIKEDIKTSFQEYVVSLINKHVGMTDKKLCKMYDRPYNNNKAQWNDLTFRMLGIKGNHAAEFQKANIVVKTIRIEENEKNRENMSFAPFKFKELVQEEWEDSKVFNYFDTTQFLFVVFKRVDDVYVLQKAKIWHMPYHDLNVTAYKLRNGFVIGNVERDAEKLPNGEWMTNQSFWLNREYVLKQLIYKGG